MEKFSDLKREFITETFSYTDSDFYNYIVFIDELMYQMHSERAVNLAQPGEKDVIVYKAFDYEKNKMPGREYSVLGKVNTNKKLISRIASHFEIKDYSDLKNCINEFKESLFTEDGEFFKSGPTFSVWDTIRSTEEIGEKNEEYVSNFISGRWGPESNPVREVTSSYKDMILGIDITFNIDGVEKTCQVKPLKDANFKERGVVVIITSGVMKDYKTDFLAFVNIYRTYGDKCLFFKNQGVIYDKKAKTITIPYQNLVNKKY
jgi:hypothetical protein